MSGSEVFRAYIGLGANLGDAAATLRRAIEALDHIPGTHVVARSSLYRSAPVDAAGPDFINAVVAVDTALDATALLHAMQSVEAGEGRERPYLHAPRTLDLDLLTHEQTVLDSTELTLPHARMHLRAFVLKPLAEIAPGLFIPGRGPVAHYLEEVSAQKIELLR